MHVVLQPWLADDPRFDSNARRNEHRAELKAIILGVFAELTAAQVIARLEDARIANARMNTMAEVWAHPQLQARGRVQPVDTPEGPLDALLPPGAHSSFGYRMDPIPAVGEHTETILRSLGRTGEQLAALRASKAI
jgi:itaconate CoA-transferase